MPSIKIYSKEQVDDLISGVAPPTVEQTTGQSTTSVMSQKAVTDELANKADTSALPTIVQTTGSSTTDIMSQDAVTTALGNKADTSALPTSSQLVPSTSGASSGDVLSFDGTNIDWTAGGGGGMSAHTYTSWTDFYNDLLSHKENCVVVYDYSSTVTLRSVSLEFSTNSCMIGFTRPRESLNIQYFRIEVYASNTVAATYINALSGTNWQSGTINVAIGSFTLWY